MRSMSRLLTTAACVLILTSSCRRGRPQCELVSFAALRAISPARQIRRAARAPLAALLLVIAVL